MNSIEKLNMEKSELKIGSEVYVNAKYNYRDDSCTIGKIIGETPRYWKIKFGESEPSLFLKNNLRQKGGDIWNSVFASPLTEEKRNKFYLLKKREL